MLALHTATGYEERGVSVMATVGGGQYEPGLSASLRPRWGAPGYGAESLWQDQFQGYTQGPRQDEAGVDARVGYGMRLPGGQLLTPFGGYGQMGSGRRLQVGANLGSLGLFGATSTAPCRSSSWASAMAGPVPGPTIASPCSGSLTWGKVRARRAARRPRPAQGRARQPPGRQEAKPSRCRRRSLPLSDPLRWTRPVRWGPLGRSRLGSSSSRQASAHGWATRCRDPVSVWGVAGYGAVRSGRDGDADAAGDGLVVVFAIGQAQVMWAQRALSISLALRAPRLVHLYGVGCPVD